MYTSSSKVGKFSDKCLKVPYLHKVYWTNYQIQLASRLIVEAKLSCEIEIGVYLICRKIL